MCSHGHVRIEQLGLSLARCWRMNPAKLSIREEALLMRLVGIWGLWGLIHSEAFIFCTWKQDQLRMSNARLLLTELHYTRSHLAAHPTSSPAFLTTHILPSFSPPARSASSALSTETLPIAKACPCARQNSPLVT